MMSALVLAPNLAAADGEVAGERCIRSLGWLVSAVVAGVIGDVVLAVPPALGLGEAAERVGCRLVEGDEEGERLQRGVAACKKARLLVMRSGFAADRAMVDELDTLRGEARAGSAALIRTAPETALQRLVPRFAPVVGIVILRQNALPAQSFNDLVRLLHGRPPLRSRAHRLL